MQNKNFFNADDVSTYMDISKTLAYKIIRELNNELKSKGYLTVCGKVNRQYFEQKIYSSLTAQTG